MTESAFHLGPAERAAITLIEDVGGEVADLFTNRHGRLCAQVFHHNADEMIAVQLAPTWAARFAERYR